MELMQYTYDDGGRAKYFRGETGDCVCRAISIVSGRDYKEIYDAIFKAMGKTPRNGVDTRSPKFKRLMASLGFSWTSTAGIGSHQAVHFYPGELPQRRMVCSVAKHYTAVVDNEVRDIFDCRLNSFGEPRRIYGYWTYNG